MNDQFRISYLGDSHSVLTFGKNIVQFISDFSQEHGWDFHFLALSGLLLTEASQWKSLASKYSILNYENINGNEMQSKSLNGFNFNFSLSGSSVFILALGTNDLVAIGNGHLVLSEAREKWIMNLKLMTNSVKIFIEPPLVLGNKMPKRLDQSRRLLLELVNSLGFIVIRNWGTSADQNDQVHLTKAQAEIFANRVIPALKFIMSSQTRGNY